MNQEFELIAKTFQGLEDVLAKELIELGANDVQIGRRMVSFKGDKTMMYKANFCLRTAIRILKPIKHFQANDADTVYEQVKQVPWESFMDNTKSFAVDSVVYSEEFRHSKFVAYKVKDAIADYFREKTGDRPSVSVTNPDISINIHIAEDQCTLSLDSSGESLHRRGYRQGTMEAPLNEVLAAGMIMLTGWHGECDLIDPMCGSGTIPIEAALIAQNIAPGVFRKGYAFEKWNDFDAELLEMVYNDDSNEREFTHHIYAYDNSPKAIEMAEKNIKAAGVSKVITLKVQPFQQFEQPEEKSIIITNPPYGERISSEDLLGLYQMIGERFKHAFTGNDAWVLSYKEECFDSIGLKPSDRISLFNGALACEFRRYQIFGGRYNDYRTDHHEDKFKTNRGTFRPHHLGEKRADIQRRDREDSEDGKKRFFKDRNSKEGSREERSPRREGGKPERKPFGRREQSEGKPRGERKFGDRKSGEKSGERRTSGERKYSDRKRGEKPSGERKYGKKPASFDKKGKSPRKNNYKE